jgi:hypothetical protein
MSSISQPSRNGEQTPILARFAVHGLVPEWSASCSGCRGAPLPPTTRATTPYLQRRRTRGPRESSGALAHIEFESGAFVDDRPVCRFVHEADNDGRLPRFRELLAR